MSFEQNSIVVFSFGSFPYGGAATNRIISYLRGLSEIGCNINLYVLSPAPTQIGLSNKKILNYRNVNITYTTNVLFTKNKIHYFLNQLIGIYLGLIKLLSIGLKKEKPSAIFLLFTNPIILFFFIICGKLLKFKLFHERTEFPFINYKNKILLKFYLKYLLPAFDGLIVISSQLEEYYGRYFKKKILLLPMTVEIDRFYGIIKEKKEDYIAYCGSMYTDKDGIPDLIEAFKIIAKKNFSIKLYLIGDNSDKNKFAFINKCIIHSGVSDRIICTGYIDKDKIPQVLLNAKVLALSRPNNIQAKGGFPTKLGEYLMTGNPVVVTDVGDHNKFLKDGESAFISEPDNPIHFAKKLIEALTETEKATKIGLKGKEVAINNFNYKKHALKLFNFIFA